MIEFSFSYFWEYNLLLFLYPAFHRDVIQRLLKRTFKTAILLLRLKEKLLWLLKYSPWVCGLWRCDEWSLRCAFRCVHLSQQGNIITLFLAGRTHKKIVQCFFCCDYQIIGPLHESHIELSKGMNTCTYEYTSGWGRQFLVDSDNYCSKVTSLSSSSCCISPIPHTILREKI